MPANDFTINHLSLTDLIKFFSNVTIHDEVTWNGTPCWLWTRFRRKYGHGTYYYRNSNVFAHRFTFAWLVHPLPRGKKHGEIDHLCKNPPCCNPLHLEFVPSGINVLRGSNPCAINARKTHCINGHLLDEANTYIEIDKNGTVGRKCRICGNARVQKFIDADPDRMRKYKREYARKRYVPRPRPHHYKKRSL